MSARRVWVNMCVCVCVCVCVSKKDKCVCVSVRVHACVRVYVRVRSGYGKSGKSMEFVFSISRPGKSMEICEKLWKLQKKVWNFLPSAWEKIWRPKVCLPLERSEAAAARLTESSSRVVPSFHICSYSSYKLCRAGPELLARRFKQKRHARNSSFVKKRSFPSQAVDPDFRLTAFVNEKFSPEPVICSLLLTLPP